MTILLDSRVGSKDLLHWLGDCATLTKLEFGDACWIGQGVDDETQEGCPVQVGVERKNVNDLIQSIDSGRLAGHQLTGLLQTYSVNYLIIEGQFRPSDSGSLEMYQRGKWTTATRPGGTAWHYGEVSNFINSMSVLANFHIRQTNSPRETAHLIRWLSNWWNKPWHSHNSLKAIHSCNPTAKRGKGSRSKMQIGVPLSKQQQIILKCLAQVPGVEQRARILAPHFNSLMEAAVLTENDWMTYPGIGKVLAGNLVQVFQGL